MNAYSMIHARLIPARATDKATAVTYVSAEIKICSLAISAQICYVSPQKAQLLYSISLSGLAFHYLQLMVSLSGGSVCTTTSTIPVPSACSLRLVFSPSSLAILLMQPVVLWSSRHLPLSLDLGFC